MEHDTPNCLHAVIHGRVQGVGFRVFARECAQRHRVNGWVKNLASGSVEVFAEGDENTLMEFLTDLHRGPIMSHVRDIDVDWTTAPPSHSAFEIIR